MRTINLKPVGKFELSSEAALYNMRKELKHYFKTVKFSVKIERYTISNTVYVSYEGEVDVKQLRQILDKYEAGKNPEFSQVYGTVDDVIIDK